MDLKEDKSAQMVFAAEPLKRGEQVAVKSYEGAFGATLPRNVPSIQGESTCAPSALPQRRSPCRTTELSQICCSGS